GLTEVGRSMKIDEKNNSTLSITQPGEAKAEKAERAEKVSELLIQVFNSSKRTNSSLFFESDYLSLAA
ncbi:MAG: hypothetical protein ABIQ11_05635, partial [Saprospiraceae bacterium]